MLTVYQIVNNILDIRYTDWLGKTDTSDIIMKLVYHPILEGALPKAQPHFIDDGLIKCSWCKELLQR